MITRKYISYGLKDFIDGRKNILFVTGYMGSGKSTISKDFAKRYNARTFSLDNVFDWNETWVTTTMDTAEQRLYFELLKNSGAYRDLGDGIGSYDRAYKTASYAEKCAWIMKQAIKDCSRTNRIIIEGVQLYQYDSLFPIYINYPLLIMDLTSDEAMKSNDKRDKDYGLNFFQRLDRRPGNKRYYTNQYNIFSDYLAKVKGAKGEPK